MKWRSVFLKTRAENGWVRYECGRDGKWAAVAMSADLRDSNTGNIVGRFSSQGHRDVSTWTVLNDEGDRAESGHVSSIVSGTIRPLRSCRLWPCIEHRLNLR
jgi:hypothetical protein